MQGWCARLFLTYCLILRVTLFLALLCSWRLFALPLLLLLLPPPPPLVLSSRMPLRRLCLRLLPPLLLLPTCLLTAYLVLGVRVSSPLVLPLPFPPLLTPRLLALLLPLPRPLRLLLSPLLLLLLILLLPGLPFLLLPLFLPLSLSRVLQVYRGWVWVIPCLLGFPLVHRIHPRIPLIPLLLRPTGLTPPLPLMTRVTLLTQCRVMMTLSILLFRLTRIALNIAACLIMYAGYSRNLLVSLRSILHRSPSSNRSLRLLLRPLPRLLLTGLSRCGRLSMMQTPS